MDAFFEYKSYKKKQITAFKNRPVIVEKASYSLVTSRSETILKKIYLLVSNAMFTNSYNKANKIIVKLNNKDLARDLDNQYTENIVGSINLS